MAKFTIPYAEIKRLREQGLTWTDIGKRFGVSGATASRAFDTGADYETFTKNQRRREAPAVEERQTSAGSVSRDLAVALIEKVESGDLAADDAIELIDIAAR